MKHKAVVQSQVASLRNLKNQVRQLTTSMSKRSQDSLPNNTEDLRRDEKKHCKVINLRFAKDVHIPISVPKKRVEPVLTHEETQVKEEPE